jgi:NADH-quinone oxidoreductase subunit H
MGFAWKTMIPLSILNIIFGAIWYEIVIRPPAHKIAYLWFLPIDLTWWYGALVTLPLILVSAWGLIKLGMGAPAERPTVTGERLMRRRSVAVR